MGLGVPPFLNGPLLNGCHPLCPLHVKLIAKTNVSVAQLPEDSPQYCISAVIGGGSQPYLVLGDPFMRAFYSVFTTDSSGQNAKVGLALST